MKSLSETETERGRQETFEMSDNSTPTPPPTQQVASSSSSYRQTPTPPPPPLPRTSPVWEKQVYLFILYLYRTGRKSNTNLFHLDKTNGKCIYSHYQVKMKTTENMIVNASSLQSLEGHNLPLKTKCNFVRFDGKEKRKSRNRKLFQRKSLGES